MTTAQMTEDMPAFLVRPKRDIPINLDQLMKPPAKTLVKTEVDRPLTLAADGLNMIQTSLFAGSNEETGLHRYLVVRMGTKMADLLYIPTLEHIQVEVRYLNERIAKDKAHWFAVPTNLGQRLIDKAVQWEMAGSRYSRALVNEALVALGYPALETKMPTVAGTNEEQKREKKMKIRTERGPGVIDTIIAMLTEGPHTVDEMVAKLGIAFPDRAADGMKGTVRTQLNRLPKQGRLVIVKEGDKYRAENAPAAKPKGTYLDMVKEEVLPPVPAPQKPAGQGKGQSAKEPPTPPATPPKGKKTAPKTAPKKTPKGKKK